MTVSQINTAEGGAQSRLEIVVAHYREDLQWLMPSAELVTVYSKGGPDEAHAAFARQITLPNIGRESHTYLYHIVNNYDRLADVTLFTQGDVVEHVGPDVNITHMLDVCKALPEEPFIGYTFRGLYRFESWSGIDHIKHWKADKDSGAMRSAGGS